MDPLFSLSLAIIVSIFFLGASVLRAGKKDRSTVTFFSLSTLMALWLVANLGVDYFVKTESVNTSLVQLTNLFATWTAYAFLLFASAFPVEAELSTRRLVGLYSIVPLLLTPVLFSPAFMSPPLPGDTRPVLGPAVPYHLAYLVATASFAILLLATKVKRVSELQKKQITYVLYGLGITTILALIFSALLPLIFDNSSSAQLTPLATIFFVGFAAYTITRHSLFNTKIILTEIAAFALIVFNGSQLISAESLGDIVFRSLTFLLVAVLGIVLVKSVKNEVGRREEVERLAKERIETLKELEQRNKNLAALQKVSKMVLNQIEMKPMIQAILDEIPKQFDNCTGALLNLVHGGHMAAYAISTNEFTRKVTSLVGDDLEKYSYPIKPGFNLLHDTLISKQIKESTKLSEFICPPITKPVAATIQTLVGIKYTLAVPLFAGKEPLGVMLFSYRVPKEQLLDKDIDMAVAISDETSLAIQRAYAFQQLKDANEYLADLDKLKDEFISIASHELNTPLAAVEGYLSMILDENMGKVDDKARIYLTRAYDSSKRLAELILDLLNVSRIEQGRIKMKFAKTNLYDLAESVMHELQVKVDAKKLTLKLEGDRKKVPQTWCDPDRIREVIVNLVGNAIKYTDRGGIRMRISEDAGRIRFEVIDTGRGISAEGQKKLFQKFSQVKREIDEQKGTGLGLYISKNFIELHKGRIWVESEEDKGSDFIFELPLLTEPPSKVEGAILEGPLSAPQVEIRDKKPPAIITASSTSNKLTS